MQTLTILTVLPLLAVGAFVGWVASSGRLTDALAEGKKLDPASPPTTGSTPKVLHNLPFTLTGKIDWVVIHLK